MSKETLGELEHQVLLAVLRLGSHAYTVPILAELEERTGREVAHAAIYISLRRLEDKGFTRSEMRRVEDERRSRSRRYFSVTEPGLGVLREGRRRFVRLWEGLDSVLEETQA